MDSPGIGSTGTTGKRKYVSSGKYSKAAAAASDPSRLIDLNAGSPAAVTEGQQTASPEASGSPLETTAGMSEQSHGTRTIRKPRRTKAQMDAARAAEATEGKEQQPRKRRRTKAQMAVARAEEARQKEAKASTKAAQTASETRPATAERPVRLPTAAGTFVTDASGRVLNNAPAAKRRQTREAREFGRAQEEAARRALLGPVDGGVEMVLQFDQSPVSPQQHLDGSGGKHRFALDPQLMADGLSADEEDDAAEQEDPLADLERAGEDNDELADELWEGRMRD